MSAPIRKVSFEVVDSSEHPEYYRNALPIVSAADVPDEHWTYTERVGHKVSQQYDGLARLAAAGELIRNVQLFEDDGESEPQWRTVTRDGGNG